MSKGFSFLFGISKSKVTDSLKLEYSEYSENKLEKTKPTMNKIIFEINDSAWRKSNYKH